MVKSLNALGLVAANGANPELSGIAVDSREVRKGFLFVAMLGVKVHGACFVKTALELGAVAILTDAEGAALASEEISEFGAAVVISDKTARSLEPHSSFVVWCAATGDDGGHRNEWQNFGQYIRAPNLGRIRIGCGQLGYYWG